MLRHGRDEANVASEAWNFKCLGGDIAAFSIKHSSKNPLRKDSKAITADGFHADMNEWWLNSDLGSFCVTSLKRFQVWPLLPDAVQHLLETHHLFKIPPVACKQFKYPAINTVFPIFLGINKIIIWVKSRVIQRLRCLTGQHLPSKGMYSMKRTSRGFVSVSDTNSSSSSSLRPRITTQLTCRGRQTPVNH